MRQYIGARYVPKFADPILHDPTRSYEAFEIVQNALGDSFTSRKPVPVGVALTDTTYWVSSGNFNAQLAIVENDLSDLQTYVDKYMGVRRSRNVLLIGDSYMRGDHADTDTIESVIASGLNANTYNYSYGGSGYYANPGHTFIEQIQNAIADDNLDKTIITDVLIGGGYNDDLSLTESDYQTAMQNIIDLIEANMPDAVIWFAPMFWTNGTYNLSWAQKHNNMVNAAVKTGHNVYKDCDILLYRRDSSYIYTDGVHPTSKGYKVIGDYMSEWMNGTYITPEYFDARDITLAGGETANLYYEVKDRQVFVKLYFYSSGAYGVDQDLIANADLPDVIKAAQPVPMTGSVRAMSNDPVNVRIDGSVQCTTAIPVNANITLCASYPFTPYMY